MDFHRHLNVSISPVKEKRSHFLGTHQWRTSQTFDSQEIWRETIGERGRRGFSFFVRGERTAAKEKLNRPDGNSRLRSRIVSLSNAYPFPFCPCVYRPLYANNRRRVRARAILKLLDIENGIWRMMVGGGKECLVLVPIDDPFSLFLSRFLFIFRPPFRILPVSPLYSDLSGIRGSLVKIFRELLYLTSYYDLDRYLRVEKI